MKSIAHGVLQLVSVKAMRSRLFSPVIEAHIRACCVAVRNYRACVLQTTIVQFGTLEQSVIRL